MKRVIFTYYEKVDAYYQLEENNQKAIDEYFDRLLQNKKEYAESIDVDFLFFDAVPEKIKKTSTNTFGNSEDNFINVNLHKHLIMDDLAKQYDEVMYVDMDVVFNTNENVFEEIDLTKGIAVKDSDNDIETKEFDESILYIFGKKNPTCKYLITKAMLGNDNCHVINTGIVIGKSKDILKIKFHERLNSCIKLINKLKKQHDDSEFFYPNNEAIFAYILEKYNINYQLMDNKWHDIRNHVDNPDPLGNIIHIINKNFDLFFNDKKKVIFSIYIDIPNKKLDDACAYKGDEVSKSKRTQLELKKYFSQLVENKKEYAEICSADYILFEHDKKYNEFAKQFPDLSEYNIVNLYKIYLMYELSKDYDNILYLDFDVMYHKPVSFFDVLNVQHCIHVNWDMIRDVNFINTNIAEFDYRSPFIKYWNSRALLDEDGIDTKNLVDLAFNTGIVGASKHILQELDFWSDIHDTIQKMKELKEDPFSMYPPSMTKSFGYDNETIFGYKIFKNDVTYIDLSSKWHYKVQGNPLEAKYSKEDILEKDPVLIHFINKKIGWYLKELKGHDIEVDY